MHNCIASHEPFIMSYNILLKSSQSFFFRRFFFHSLSTWKNWPSGRSGRPGQNGSEYDWKMQIQYELIDIAQILFRLISFI